MKEHLRSLRDERVIGQLLHAIRPGAAVPVAVRSLRARSETATSTWALTSPPCAVANPGLGSEARQPPYVALVSPADAPVVAGGGGKAAVPLLVGGKSPCR